MKNLINLVLVLVIAIVLGCKCTTTGNVTNSGTDSPRNTDSSSNAKEQPKETPLTIDDEDEPPPIVKPSIKENGSPRDEDDEGLPNSQNSEKSPSKDSTDSKIPTLRQYNQINNGMSLDEVNEIIGFEGQLIKRNGTSSRYLWGDNNSFIMISFENDKVIFKSQEKLK